MKREYYKIYEMLYADYLYELDFRDKKRLSLEEYSLVRSLKRFIDLANKSEILRPDAKYFLLTNFHQMIIKPILETRYVLIDNDRKGRADLEQYIQDDIKTIILESTHSSFNFDQDRISGHRIMKTIDQLWKKLKCTRLDIWG